jgi:hypothetical protein
MDADLAYKLVAGGRSGFVRLHWEHLDDDFTDPDGATSPSADLADFRTHLETTYDYMNSGREGDFEDCLEALCRHFAAAVPNHMAFAMCLQDLTLLDSLIENFDKLHFMEVSLLLAELFVNLLALDPRFVTRFLKQHTAVKKWSTCATCRTAANRFCSFLRTTSLVRAARTRSVRASTFKSILTS